MRLQVVDENGVAVKEPCEVRYLPPIRLIISLSCGA